jgi:hypothetical protein
VETAKLIFLSVAGEIESGTYLLYDGACGTGGMLTVAEETLQELAAAHGKQVSTHLYGQEINAETYAICKADLLLKGEGDAADNIVGGPAHSTLAYDAFPSREFDFMLSNPPYGKSWKSDLERMGGKGALKDPRDTEQVPLLEEGGIEAFLRREVLPHAADAWYVPASVKTGYEISFTRYFYKPQPLRTLEEIRADILALEKETKGLLGEIIGGGT